MIVILLTLVEELKSALIWPSLVSIGDITLLVKYPLALVSLEGLYLSTTYD